jgi:hypothetical protein
MPAMKFFPAPTATFLLLYCFAVIRSGGKRNLHSHAMENLATELTPWRIQAVFPRSRCT